jgi:DNA mismatch repair protein MutS2
MTYCGMHLPAAEGTTIGAFLDLACDLGDEQSIAENASTFSAHVRRLRTIVESAGERSLVLIDEIASGTEPAAGAALAVALLEHLRERGAHGIVTTHATELKLFAHATPGFRNASVRFDAASYAPTYQLDVGAPGQSLAFRLARSLGLEPSIVTRAEALLSESERDYDRALGELSDIRAQAASERDALRAERAKLGELETLARGRSESLERERRTLAQQAEARLARALREFANELERRYGQRPGRPRVTPGQSALLANVLDDVHRDLGLQPRRREEPAAPARESGPNVRVSIGDAVFVPAFGTEGSVVDDYGDNVLVAVGAMKTVVSKKELRPTGAVQPERSKSRGGQATLEAASSASSGLDVRGRRFVEAEPLVEKWLDEATLLGLSPLRLIHGKGTGLLGRGLQEFLRGHGAVESVRYGNADEGGGGVTVIELKKTP